VLFAIPLLYAIDAGYLSQAAFRNFERPLMAIMERVPPYASLIETEVRFCQRHGLLPP
jgi:hypothetical protein